MFWYHLEQIVIQTFLENLQQWRSHDYESQAVPLLNSSHYQESIPYFQVGSCSDKVPPIAYIQVLWKINYAFFYVVAFQILEDYYVSPQISLIKLTHLIHLAVLHGI